MIKTINEKEFSELVYNTATFKPGMDAPVFIGDKPCIIDFYADWCQPCKTIAPILKEIADERDDINIYKINVEENKELSAMFGIRSIPTMLFIPKGSAPQMTQGALDKKTLSKVIEEILLENGISDAEIIEEPEA